MVRRLQAHDSGGLAPRQPAFLFAPARQVPVVFPEGCALGRTCSSGMPCVVSLAPLPRGTVPSPAVGGALVVLFLEMSLLQAGVCLVLHSYGSSSLWV